MTNDEHDAIRLLQDAITAARGAAIAADKAGYGSQVVNPLTQAIVNLQYALATAKGEN